MGPEFQPPRGREPKPPQSLTSTGGQTRDKKTLRDVLPPLCASRLKPIRQKTKNAVVSTPTPPVPRTFKRPIDNSVRERRESRYSHMNNI